MIDYILIGSFLIPPVAAVVWFVTSLVKYIKTPADDAKKRVRRALLIASSVVGGLVFISYVSLVAVFIIAIAYM